MHDIVGLLFQNITYVWRFIISVSLYYKVLRFFIISAYMHICLIRLICQHEKLRSKKHQCTSHNHNQSKSSFRLVIMTLVDVANGRNRHVPYRDSRLTFLLQVKIQKKKHAPECPPSHCVHFSLSGSLSHLSRIPQEGTLKRQLLQMSAHLFGIHLLYVNFTFSVFLDTSQCA